MEDSRIIDLYWERSERAILETDQKYGAYCRKIARNITEDREDAEECVNDTWYRAWMSMPSERPACLQAFVGKITRNLSLNSYRNRRARKRGQGKTEVLLEELEECLPARESTEEKVEGRLLADSISQFLKSKPEADRLVFIRRYWYADSIGEIAEQFEMSESKVKSLLFRTRNQLKRYLEQEGVCL